MIDNMCENVDRSVEHGSRGDRECIFTISKNSVLKPGGTLCRLYSLLVCRGKYNFSKICVITTKPRTPERPQQDKMLNESTTRSS